MDKFHSVSWHNAGRRSEVVVAIVHTSSPSHLRLFILVGKKRVKIWR
jgi:hypothetical protein